MKLDSAKIIFAGGGTGGHVYPALATIEALKQKGNFELLFVGGYHGIENRIIPDDVNYKKIWISGFQRFFTVRNFLFPLKLLVSLFQSLHVLLKFKPDAVVGTGGYVSGPVVYTAAKMGIPTLIQEQDSYPGVTTRLLSRYSDTICVPYQHVIQYLKKIKGRIVVTGVPVRPSLKMVTKQEAVLQWGFKVEQPLIFVFGGSQGAHSINKAVKHIGQPLLQKYRLQLLWQTGENNYSEVKSWSIAKESGVRILDYIKAMDLAYSAADIIISRAGAITLAELAMVQKPCILIPYPFAAAQHQKKNALTITGIGAAILVNEDENLEQKLSEAMVYLLDHPEEAAMMGEKWKQIYQPDAADKIADQIIKLIEKNHENQIGKN
jgi:UDP-N-acetylglucosamine--N-acetylmuramyl-(pentapeptide) pyrophosphoryl-undecaprenol N-acetylglucosamine transferase